MENIDKQKMLITEVNDNVDGLGNSIQELKKITPVNKQVKNKEEDEDKDETEKDKEKKA